MVTVILLLYGETILITCITLSLTIVLKLIFLPEIIPDSILLILVKSTCRRFLPLCLVRKKGKAAGPDRIAMEAFIYGNSMLFMHLSFLFNLFLMHCYIPPQFMQSLIVPLVKAKGGDLTGLMLCLISSQIFRNQFV